MSSRLKSQRILCRLRAFIPRSAVFHADGAIFDLSLAAALSPMLQLLSIANEIIALSIRASEAALTEA